VNENIIKQEISPSDAEKLSNFSKSIKAKDFARTNDYLEKIMRARTANIVLKPDYTSKDDEWISGTKTFIFDNYKALQNNENIKLNDSDLINDTNALSKIEIHDLVNLYEKHLYQSILNTEERLARLEDEIFKGLASEDYFYKQNFEGNDSLVDLRMRYHEEEIYLNYLEKKQNEAKELERMEIELGPPKDLQKIGRNGSLKISPTLTKRYSQVVDERLCQICNEDSSNQDTMISCSVRIF